MKARPPFTAIAIALALSLSSCNKAKEKASDWVSSASDKVAEQARKELQEELDSLDAYLQKPIKRTEPVFPLSEADYPLLKGYAKFSADHLPDSLLPHVDKFFFMEKLVRPDACMPLLWPYQLCAGDVEGHLYDASYPFSLTPSPLPPNSPWHFHELLKADVRDEWFFAQTYDISKVYTSEPQLEGFAALNMLTHEQWFWTTEDEFKPGSKKVSGITPELKDWHAFRMHYEYYR